MRALLMILFCFTGCFRLRPQIVIDFSSLERVESVAVKETSEAAVNEAPQEGYQLYVFSTDHCPPCATLAAELKKLEAIGWKIGVGPQRSVHIVTVKADDDAEGKKLADKYSVNRFPTMLIISLQGREKDRAIGTRPANAIADWLNGWLKTIPVKKPNA